MAETVAPAEVAAAAPTRRPAAAVSLERFWAFATDRRLARALFAALLAALGVGALGNPERLALADLQSAVGDRWWFPVYRWLGLDDPFGSWWFLLLLVVLALSLVAGTLDRLPALIAALRGEARLTPEVLRRVQLSRSFESPTRDREQAAARVAALWRARGFSAQRPPAVAGEEGTLHLFAERGRPARFAGTAAHLGVLVLLLGSLADRLGGAQGQINVPMDGGAFDHVYRRTASGSTYKEDLGFTVRVDGFRLSPVSATASAAAPSFESDLAVVEGEGSPAERVIQRKTVKPGQPFSWGGWTLYQTSYQAAPERDRARLHVLDKQSGTGRDLALAHSEEVKVGSPGAEVGLKAINYTPNLADLGPALQIERTEGDKHSRFWVLEKYPDFDADDRGDRFGLRFDGLTPFYFSGLIAAKAPGFGVWLIGCALLLLGVALLLAGPHQRLWATIDGRGQVVVAGIAQARFATFRAFFGELLAALGAPAESQRSKAP